MGISIYLSNSNIQIAVGEGGRNKSNIHQIYSVGIQEGSLLNGVITSEADLTKELTSIWEQFKLPQKGVRLVIDSTQFFTKVATFPRQSEKKMRVLLENEFSELENPEKFLFDYRELGAEKRNGLVSVICAATPKDYIEAYRNLFAGMGISLESMDVALNARLKTFQYILDLKYKTFISLTLDGSSLASTLFVDGAYKYFNRTRIFSEAGSADFGLEVARTVSSIMQFHSSEKYEHPIECVLMGNFDVEEYRRCEQSIAALGLPIEKPGQLPKVQMPSQDGYYVYKELAKGNSALDFVYPLGSLIDENKDINFIKRHQRIRKETQKAINVKTLLPAGTALLLCVMVSVGVVGINMKRSMALNKANAYINSPSNVEQYEKAKELQSKIKEVQDKIAMGEFAKEVRDSFPMANSKVQSGVKASAVDKVSITIDSFDAVTGLYEFTAMASEVTYIYDFINQLRITELFSDLEYSGYNYTETTSQYEIQVSVRLSEHAGK